MGLASDIGKGALVLAFGAASGLAALGAGGLAIYVLTEPAQNLLGAVTGLPSDVFQYPLYGADFTLGCALLYYSPYWGYRAGQFLNKRLVSEPSPAPAQGSNTPRP